MLARRRFIPGASIRNAPLARETVEQVDDVAGRVKAKRVETAHSATLPSLQELS